MHVDQLARLLLQIAVILCAAQLVGHLVTRFGQPKVIGEILAGILLGPSALGLLAPGLLAWLFPPASLPMLEPLSQLGVLLFIFIVGIDVDAAHFRQRARSFVVISVSGVALPFALGCALATLAFASLAAPGTARLSFVLFLGIAMSITAFPVLARILQERGLQHSQLGQAAVACAAMSDALAWCLLAIVLAVAGAGDFADALLALLLAGGFGLFMYAVVRPRFERWIGTRQDPPADDALAVVAVLVAAFLSAAFTQAAGLHALFGAFVAGLIVPAHSAFADDLRKRLHTVSALLLLPLFFAYTGLRTQLGLLETAADWAWCAAITLLAIAGKLGGAMLAARATGRPWREAFALGALMNTRGLMELVVLNIGYDLGLLSPRLFTMFVIMALVTTWMAGPLVSAALRRKTPA